MTEYIVKSMFCFLVLYLGYMAFFRNSRNYEINRIVLLFSVLFALVVPALKMTPANLPVVVLERTGPLQQVLSNHNSLIGSEVIRAGAENNAVGLPEIAFAVYFLVCAGLLLRFIFNISLLLIKVYKSEKIVYNGIKLTLVEGSINPFTFFNTVFISRTTYLERKTEDELILHELAHKTQMHSVDVIILELIQIFFWFNPFVYLFKRLVKANHEYLADDFVVKSGIACYDYSNKLINHTFRREITGLSSGFNHGFIKNRLVRLSKYNQTRRPAYQLALFIPLLALLFTSTAFTNPIAESKSFVSDGGFNADAIFWSAESTEIWLKGKVNAKFGHNDFTGDGEFSLFDKGSLLIIDGKRPALNSSISITGKKCSVLILSKSEALAKYGLPGQLGAVEITTSE